MKLLDLRGSSNATRCAYTLYMYSPDSNVYKEWCATSQPASVWQDTFYLHPSWRHWQKSLVDISFTQNDAAATGAVWISFEGYPSLSRHIAIMFYRPTPLFRLLRFAARARNRQWKLESEVEALKASAEKIVDKNLLCWHLVICGLNTYMYHIRPSVAFGVLATSWGQSFMWYQRS